MPTTTYQFRNVPVPGRLVSCPDPTPNAWWGLGTRLPGAGPYRAPAHCARLEFAKHCWRPLTYNDKLARGKMAHVAADSSSSSMADQLSVSLGQEYRVKLGRSFTFPEQNSFHTIKCKKFRPRPIYNACNVIYMCSDI